LVPAWVLGICSQIGKTLAFDLGPDIAAQLGQPGRWLDGLALTYQLGLLILPALMVIVAWLLVHRDALAGLVDTGGRSPDPRVLDTRRPDRAELAARGRRRPRRRG